MYKILEEIQDEWKEYRETLDEFNGEITEWNANYIDYKVIEQVESLLKIIKNQREDLLRMYDENYRLTETICELVEEGKKLKEELEK